MKNRGYHAGIRQSPYKAMFGIEPRIGLSSTKMPADLLQNLTTEEDLEHLLDSQEIQNQNDLHINSQDQTVIEKDKSHEQELDEQEIHETNIRNCRKRAYEGLVKQAKKMKLISDKLHVPGNIGDNVTIPVPDVDKAKTDLRNVMGIILKKNEDDLYTIGTKYGTLNKLYCR